MWRILYFTQLAGAQLGEGDGGRSPLPFFQNQKKCPDCVHPYIKYSSKSIKEKKLRNFTLRGLFTGIFDEMFIGVP